MGTKQLARIERKGAYRGASSKKPVVPTSTGTNVNKKPRNSNERP